jgi:hypothetical protein
MIISFFTAYLDPETGYFEMDIRKISKKYWFKNRARYLSSWFIIDVLSIFPWEEMSSVNLNVFKLLKTLRLIRLVRLFKLLNEDKVNTLVLRLLSNLTMENKINISYIIKYVFKIFRLLLLGIGITIILACLWYILVSNIHDPSRPSFYDLINIPENSNFRK